VIFLLDSVFRAALKDGMQKYTINESKPPKVALAAIASNESAYLAEWIHHHLYFGVDLIDITVNRSSDPSEGFLDAICRADPRVQFSNGDDLDNGRPGSSNIQIKAYRRARKRLRRQLGPEAYVLFLDIDEFWTPADFQTRIGAMLDRAGRPGIAVFNWFALLSDKGLFAPTFRAPVSGLHDAHVKCASRLGLRLRRISAHTVSPVFPVKRWVASGMTLPKRGKFKTVKEPPGFSEAFITHRLYRSPMEYIAMLGRGRPIGDGKLFKSNRVGYRRVDDHFPWQHRFDIAPPKLVTYDASFAAFMARADLTGWQAEARMSVLARAETVIETLRSQPPEVQAEWAHVFANLNLQTITRDLEQAREKFRP